MVVVVLPQLFYGATAMMVMDNGGIALFPSQVLKLAGPNRVNLSRGVSVFSLFGKLFFF